MTKVWLKKAGGERRSAGGYMECLLREFRDSLDGYAEGSSERFRDTIVENIRVELVRSFRNGVQVGLERAGKGRVDEKRRGVRWDYD